MKDHKYLNPGQDILAVFHGGRKAIITFAESIKDTDVQVHWHQYPQSREVRIVALGFIMDSSNGLRPRLYIRPTAIEPSAEEFDHWLEYDPATGGMWVQDHSNEWITIPFD